MRAQQGGLLTQLREAEKAWHAERKVLTRQARADAAFQGATIGEDSAAAAAREVETSLAKARLSQIPPVDTRPREEGGKAAASTSGASKSPAKKK